MKNIRFIALILCFLMIVPMFVACNKNEGDQTTTTTSSSVQKEEDQQPTKPLTVADLYFEEEDEELAEGFSASPEGAVAVKDGALRVENGYGAYFIKDEDLVLNYENYESITISLDFKFEKFCSIGNASLVSPLYCDEEHVGDTNPNGYIYQMFLKVDNEGAIYFWSSRHKYVDPIMSNGVPYKIQENRSYNLIVEYNLEFGSYALILDGITLVEDSMTTVTEPEYMTGFFIRLFDANEANGNYSASIENLSIVANPY